MIRKLLLIFTLILYAAGAYAAEIRGIVVDNATSEPVIGANLVLVDTRMGAATDLDGNFIIRPVAAGTYDLRITAINYEVRIIEGISLLDNQAAEMEVRLIPTMYQLEEVVVTVGTETGSDERALQERMESVTITDGISAESISRMPDPDVSDVIRRATGVSTMGGDPVIRGLGVRYSKVSLNNAALAGTEPNRSSVSLELFPSSMMENVTISKSYTPDQFGEFGGGQINMNTWELAGDLDISASVGASYHSETTGRDFLTYHGGDLDWLGISDNRRDLPDAIATATDIIRLRGPYSDVGYTMDEMTELSRSFEDNWSPYVVNAGPNPSMNLSIGNRTTFLGRNLDFMFSGAYRHSSKLLESERNVYRIGADDEIAVQHNYNFENYTRNVALGGMGTLRYQISPLHRIAFNTLYNRDAEDETRYYEGFNSDRDKQIQDTRLRYVEQTTHTTQMSGSHMFRNILSSTLDWHVTYSRGTRYEPDTREFQYEADQDDDRFVLSDETQSGSRIFNDLVDNTYSGGVDWNLELIDRNENGNHDLEVKMGYAFISRDRTSESRFFQFTPRSGNDVDLTQTPEEIFADANFGIDGFLINEATRPTDSYDAGLSVGAVYAMFNGEYRSFRYSIGARFEHADQFAVSKELFPANPDAPVSVNSGFKNDDILPAFTLIYQLDDLTNLRFAASQTVSRPDFREMALFEFTDIIGGHCCYR